MSQECLGHAQVTRGADDSDHGARNMTRITVTVSPGAARSEIVGRHGDGWRARVAAPPERGRANDALVDLLADALGLPRARVQVVGGQTARRKIVKIDGLEDDAVDRLLRSGSDQPPKR